MQRARLIAFIIHNNLVVKKTLLIIVRCSMMAKVHTSTIFPDLNFGMCSSRYTASLQPQVVEKKHIQSLTAKYRKARISLGLDLCNESEKCDFFFEDISVFWYVV